MIAIIVTYARNTAEHMLTVELYRPTYVADHAMQQ